MKRLLTILFVFTLVSTLTLQGAGLRVGTAVVDISPTVKPFQLRSGKSTYVHDPLHVRAVAFENGQGRAVIAVMDAIGVGREMCDEAKADVAKVTGWKPEHMLIAGTTGSGKSVCINSIVASLLFRFSPEELRFVMIDPKVVELQIYNGLPHLAAPVVHDPKKVTLALKWVVNEMEKRYQIFAKVGARNIAGFNSRSKKKPEKTAQPELPLDEGEGFAVEMDQEVSVPRDEEIEIPEKLSYIVVIIDELADLMLMAKNDVENSIARITQMARAAGIHCIVATQRPSVDVITGVIKANIPARIAFQVAAKVDSRTILDAMGADKLLGKGDMLFLPPGTSNLRRVQGCLVTDDEINRIVEIVNNQAKPSYDKDMERQLEAPAPGNGGNGGGIDEDEDLIQQCIEVIRVEQKASVSLMQRRLRLGYTRAARIMDELEDRGLVGPNRGAEPREILFDVED